MQSVLDMKVNRAVRTWFLITVFCFLFSMIYEYFSFGVWSNWMGFLALIPLVLGVIPAVLAKGDMGRFWNDGVLILTAGSALLGIFEIYGTDSPYPGVMIAAGLIILCIGLLNRSLRKPMHRQERRVQN